jgi:hypothetical protein
MAIPTVPQQIVLMHSAAADEKAFEKKKSGGSTFSKAYNA